MDSVETLVLNLKLCSQTILYLDQIQPLPGDALLLPKSAEKNVTGSQNRGDCQDIDISGEQNFSQRRLERRHWQPQMNTYRRTGEL